MRDRKEHLSLQLTRAIAISAVSWALLIASFKPAFGEQAETPPWFLFDKADETIEAKMLEKPLFYDSGIAWSKEGLWISWLEFEPGKGDQIWIELRGREGSKTRLSSTAGDYANPTLTIDGSGNLWLSYEAADSHGDWNVFVRARQKNGEFAAPIMLSQGPGPNICHRVAADPTNGICVIWQDGSQKHFAVKGAWISPALRSAPAGGLLENVNCWAPSVAITPDGAAHAIWDAYEGESYNVFAKSFPTEGPANAKGPKTNLSGIISIARSANFEAHAQIASGRDGKLWVLWEEDGENWGKRYIARKPRDKKSTKMSDKIGPLHRFRRLHLAELNETAGTLTEYEIPQPSFESARQRTNAPPDLHDFGAFYEHGQLTVDGQNRPWIVYRHFYVPWIGIELATHKQENMRLYARCLLPGSGWSKLYSFSEGQGDGMQRISIAPAPDGIALTWTTGRTDRRKNAQARGVVYAEIKLAAAKAPIAANAQTRKLEPKTAQAIYSRQRPATDLGGKHYELFYGDLHRHTDISLCFSPVEGTIDDAYRYAIDVAPLDFLGITDHTHDLQMGEPLAHIWWRSRKEVNRHQLTNSFIPFFSYERSRGDTDHNVISLRDDMLRPHTYPLPEFWKELDTNTFTIPHQPFNRVLWTHQDDVHRPLLEIYQGMRNNIEEADAQEGLRGGHHFGIIASSDHLSTDASFACVWSDKPTREGIFRSMQARRTFGATAQIMLKVTAAGHWMGESFSAKTMPPIEIEAKGTDSISQIDVLVDGEVRKSFKCQSAEEKLVYEPEAGLNGKHIFFVRLEQSDGNHAWASPLWVDIN